VRETEKLAKTAGKEAAVSKQGVVAEKDADTILLEKDLKAALGMTVSIDHAAGGENGVLKIRYKDLEQLDEVCRRLSAVDGGRV